MSNLADLLALLPDNDTGAIDADDLRSVVTALHADAAAAQAKADENATAIVTLASNMDSLFTQVQNLETRVAALEAGP